MIELQIKTFDIDSAARLDLESLIVDVRRCELYVGYFELGRRGDARENLPDIGLILGGLFVDTLHHYYRQWGLLKVEFQPELVVDRVKNRNAIRSGGCELAARGPFEVEIVSSFQSGGVDDRLPQISSGHIVQVVRDFRRSQAVTGSLDRGGGFGILRPRLALASFLRRRVGILE